MKHLKKLQMIVALLMAINIVSVGYSAWSITFPTVDTHSGSFDSYPVIKTDEYLELQVYNIPFTEFCNYDPDPTNKKEDGTPDESDVTGAFMMKTANAQGYLNVSPSAAILLYLKLGTNYQLFNNNPMRVEITVSFGENSTESALFFDSFTFTNNEEPKLTESYIRLGWGIDGASAENFGVELTTNGTLLITGELTIPNDRDLTGSVQELYLHLVPDCAFDAALFENGATAKNLIFSTVVKTVD
ncbi:MAG: hypothetical protein IJX13_06370 [Clostridia bacterium]|nr:hypothetical protein [Clostridia bacterium]